MANAVRLTEENAELGLRSRRILISARDRAGRLENSVLNMRLWISALSGSVFLNVAVGAPAGLGNRRLKNLKRERVRMSRRDQPGFVTINHVAATSGAVLTSPHASQRLDSARYSLPTSPSEKAFASRPCLT